MDWKGYSLRKWNNLYGPGLDDYISFLVQMVWSIGVIGDFANITHSDLHCDNIMALPKPSHRGRWKLSYVLYHRASKSKCFFSIYSDFLFSIIDWPNFSVANPYTMSSKLRNLYSLRNKLSRSRSSSSKSNKYHQKETTSNVSPSNILLSLWHESSPDIKSPMSLRKEGLDLEHVLSPSFGVKSWFLFLSRLNRVFPDSDQFSLTDNIDDFDSIVNNFNPSFNNLDCRCYIEWEQKKDVIRSPGRPRKYKDAAEKMRIHRAIKKRKKLIGRSDDEPSKKTNTTGNHFEKDIKFRSTQYIHTLCDTPYVAVSEIEGRLGVIAIDDIKKGTLITEYTGTILTRDQFNNYQYRFQFKNIYVVTYESNTSYIDGLRYPFPLNGVGSLAKKTNTGTNAYFKQVANGDKRRVYIESLMDIKKGEEICVTLDKNCITEDNYEDYF